MGELGRGVLSRLTAFSDFDVDGLTGNFFYEFQSGLNLVFLRIIFCVLEVVLVFHR